MGTDFKLLFFLAAVLQNYLGREGMGGEADKSLSSVRILTGLSHGHSAGLQGDGGVNREVRVIGLVLILLCHFQ